MRTGRRRTLLAAALVMVLVGIGSVSTAHAARAPHATAVTITTFAGAWGGHDRGITVTKTGLVDETVYDGCCQRALHMYFQLSHPGGTLSNATATGRVTKIAYLNKRDYAADPADHIPATPKPYVGKTGRIRLKNGVITDGLDGFNSTFCDAKAGETGVCGA